MIDADDLVIGSGAGGAVTAALLAEAGRTVLVVEEGAWVGQGEVPPYSLEQMRRQYRNGGLTAALGRPAIAYAEGACAGGGTEVNAGLYHRTPADALERWRRGGVDVGELDPFYEEVERALSVQRLPGEAGRASLALAEGAERLGWQVAEVPRWMRYDGGAPKRQSMTETYLPRARAAGATIEPGVRVERLRVAGGRAVGAVVHGDGGTYEVSARRTWVCAGATGTPALLQRSGVRGVGRTLELHPTAKLVAAFEDDVSPTEVPVHQVKEFGPDLTLGGSASRPEHVALALVDDWPAGRAVADAPGRAAVYYAAVRPAGRGFVRAVPGLRDPVVGFRLARRDWRLLVSGLSRLALLLLAAGARAVHASSRGVGAIERAPDVARIAERMRPSGTSLMTVHLMSSVPLGGPTDAYGALRALAGVHVNDASLLPDAVGVNPQGSVMALAMRNVTRHLEAS